MFSKFTLSETFTVSSSFNSNIFRINYSPQVMCDAHANIKLYAAAISFHFHKYVFPSVFPQFPGYYFSINRSPGIVPLFKNTNSTYGHLCKDSANQLQTSHCTVQRMILTANYKAFDSSCRMPRNFRCCVEANVSSL